MSRLQGIALLAVCHAVTAVTAGEATTYTLVGKVVGVADGDTIAILVGGQGANRASLAAGLAVALRGLQQGLQPGRDRERSTCGQAWDVGG